MIGVGSLSPMEDAQALIKGKIGEFLSKERVIRQHMTSPSASIRSEAAALLGAQKTLEAELGTAQTKIAQFQQGAWSIADVMTLGDVGARLLQHLSSVTKLDQRARGVEPSTGAATFVFPVLGAVAVAAVALFAIRKRA